MGSPTIYQAKVAELREAIRAGEYANRPFPSESQLMLRRERPDAIACYNDRQAALLLQTLAKLGRSVPDDILVAGFDDVQYAKLTIPQLTTMHQPCAEIAAEAFRLLLDRIRNQQLPPRQVLLDAPLVVRGSTIKQKE